jgi:hypothetical protein
MNSSESLSISSHRAFAGETVWALLGRLAFGVRRFEARSAGKALASRLSPRGLGIWNYGGQR